MQTAAIQDLLEHRVDSLDPRQHSFLHLCKQIKHNLEHQHSWTDVRIHTRSPNSEDHLERPIVSGLPPARLYIHPDEQIELIKAQRLRHLVAKESASRQADVATDTSKSDPVSDTIQALAMPEREWVLPVHIREKWSLSRMAAVFDAISCIPPGTKGLPVATNSSEGTWRKIKRLAMAIASDDSTIVYYIVHDGLVKPRQN